MKKHKAFGIPTAIALCTMLLIVSIAVGSMIVVASSLNKVANVQSYFELIYRSSTHEFIKAGTAVTVDKISDTTFDWAIYAGEGEIKALVAERGNAIRFYAIYDFEHDDLLAYQSSNFYISTDGEGNKLLGGLVKYTGENL